MGTASLLLCIPCMYHEVGEIDTFLDCGDGPRDPCLAA